jgi:hypothetical protein
MPRVLAALALALAACGGGTVKATDTAGDWTGTWNNTTYGSTGSGTLKVTVDEATKNVTYILDLNGSVFGASDPPAETFSGSYASGAYKMSGNSATLGQTTINVAADGTLTGTAKPARGDVTLDGTVSASKIEINYTIKSGSDTITGKLSFSK